jgi:hypothetical protein
MNTKVDMQMNEIKDGQQLPDDSKYNFDSAIDPARSKHASSSSVEVQGKLNKILSKSLFHFNDKEKVLAARLGASILIIIFG